MELAPSAQPSNCGWSCQPGRAGRKVCCLPGIELSVTKHPNFAPVNEGKTADWAAHVWVPGVLLHPLGHIAEGPLQVWTPSSLALPHGLIKDYNS